MPYMTIILGGYYICYDQLLAWSKKEVEVNPLWKRCLDAERGLVDSALDFYFEKLRLERDVKTKEPQKAESGCCGCGSQKCSRNNFIFYRRYAKTWSMADFKSKDWAHFEEKPADREIKARLEQALHMPLPEWSILVWREEGVLYNPNPEMFEEPDEELEEEFLEPLSDGLARRCSI